MTEFSYMVDLLHKTGGAEVMVWVRAKDAKEARQKALKLFAFSKEWVVFASVRRDREVGSGVSS